MATEPPTDSSFVDISFSSAHRVEEPAPTRAPTGATAPPPEPKPAAEEPSDAAEDAKEKSKSYAIYSYFKAGKKSFYSSDESVLERAVEEVKASVVNKEVDGDILGWWLLLEVDHWDNETEKIVILTTESLLTVRYDFIPKRIYKAKKVQLQIVDTVKSGPFEYPAYSLLQFGPDFKKRTSTGVRLLWNKGEEPSFLLRWNLSSNSMPWQTYTYHPLAFTEEGAERDCYDVKHFAVALVQAIKDTYSRHHPGSSLVVAAEPLRQDIYLGFPSQIHNQSFFGMSKDRGAFSF